MGSEEGGMARQAGREGSALNGVSENNKRQNERVSCICLHIVDLFGKHC